MVMAYAEEQYALIQADIERDGRQILGVFDEPTFAYTIGNELKGLPELLFIGSARNSGFLNILSDTFPRRSAV
jgi:hypothetical protein